VGTGWKSIDVTEAELPMERAYSGRLEIEGILGGT
jgi:hypothetical protein